MTFEVPGMSAGSCPFIGEAVLSMTVRLVDKGRKTDDI